MEVAKDLSATAIKVKKYETDIKMSNARAFKRNYGMLGFLQIYLSGEKDNE
jgi:hypothetical protein